MEVILTISIAIAVVAACAITLVRMDGAETARPSSPSRVATEAASSNRAAHGCLWTLALVSTLALVWLFWLSTLVGQGIREGCSFGAPADIQACETVRADTWNLVTIDLWVSLAAFLPVLAATTSRKAAALVCLFAAIALAAFVLQPSADGFMPTLPFLVLLAESAWLLFRGRETRRSGSTRREEQEGS